MNTTVQGIDARAYLTGWLQGLVSMYSADINAIPDDKWTATFGGCTRPANELTADAMGLLYWCAEVLKGNTAPAGEGPIKELAAQITSKSVAVAKFSEVAGLFTEAFNAASDEKLAEVIDTPWGMPTPLYMICQIAVSHVWYHDGQLNYIQCLLGDEKVHWMGGE